jgi:hypothetical protein
MVRESDMSVINQKGLSYLPRPAFSGFLEALGGDKCMYERFYCYVRSN